MGRYLIRRLLMLIPVVFFVVLIVFVILRLSPNDPIRSILGDMATQEEVDAMRNEMGLNDPLPVQFYHYIKGIVTKFDFGVSYVNRHPVLSEIIDRFPISLELAIFSTLLAASIGIPLGLISACRQYSLLDMTASLLALIFLALPEFWFALMLIIVFSQRLHWFPPSGWYGVRYMVLPIIATGIGCVAGIMRTTRSNMLEVIRQDYIRTARAKGLKETTVICKHALKNALIPVITLMGMQFGRQLGGVFVPARSGGQPLSRRAADADRRGGHAAAAGVAGLHARGEKLNGNAKTPSRIGKAFLLYCWMRPALTCLPEALLILRG